MREFPCEYTVQLGCVSIVVNVTSDVNHPGSGDPFEVSDWDYYGWRDTEWEIVSGAWTMWDGSREAMTSQECESVVNSYYEKFQGLVQYMIDKESEM